jgi:hypothetical protein
VLDATEKYELPAARLDFNLESDGWEEWDWTKRDEGELEGGLLDSMRFLKGGYAAREQAFSVPIRSGLDWRKSVYVTCW